MPKVNVNYANTIIYKIICKDPSVTQLYVGHTTNFVQRKYTHKQNCANVKSSCYNLEIYKTIRANGGWCNWDMLLIINYKCGSYQEADQKEKEYYSILNAKILSPKEEQKIKIPISTFICTTCDFKCSKHSNYTAHLSTLKHHETAQVLENNLTTIDCECGNKYKHRQSLYNHKKKCQILPNNTAENAENAENNMTMTITEKEETHPKPTNLTEDMIMKLLNQNSELIKLLETQMSKNVQTNNNNNVVVNNNNNNTFNLNIYLNETCSEALNLTDFVSSLEVKLNDLEETAKIGYTLGVSRIFINGLNSLSVSKRPIHCSDIKREVLYIKNNDEWKKDEEGKTTILNAKKKKENKEKK